MLFCVGYARLCSEADKNHPPVRWVLPPGMSDKAFMGVFKMDWVNRCLYKCV